LQNGTPSQLSDVVNSQASIFAYADATMALAIVCLVCVPMVLLMRKTTAKPEAAVPLVRPPARAAARVSDSRRTDVKAA
jgi:hypothetical protein